MPAPVLLFSHAGQALDHQAVSHWAGSEGAILICGRYEGVDQRFIDAHVDQQISLGDFVLSGGEIAAMALLDAVARLQPGVLHDEGSHQQDSFNSAIDGLLDCPHYSRPELWQGRSVPAPLLSGHHAQIANWRREQSLLLTARQRPDLLQKALDNGQLTALDHALLRRPPAHEPGWAILEGFSVLWRPLQPIERQASPGFAMLARTCGH